MASEGTEQAEEAGTDETPPKGRLKMHAGQFLAHLAVVYLLVNTVPSWLAGQVHGTLLPAVERHAPTTSGFQFFFTHLMAFSAIPAFVVAFVVGQRFRHSAAFFVWTVPAAVLIYKIAVFEPVSALAPHWTAAMFQYFGGNFHIEEFHSWKQLFEIAVVNADLTRGLEQLRYTAPLYAAIGYSVGAFISSSIRMPWLEQAIRDLRPRVLGLK